jgi:hypothetical protein
MKRFLFVLFMIVFYAVPTMAQNEPTNSTGPYLFKANDVKIYVPSPTDKFIEAGYVNSGFLWKIVRDKDQSNGLFVLKNDFNHVMDGVSNADIEYSNLSRYARVQVQDKDTNLDSATFKKAVKKTKAEIGDSLASNKTEPETMLIKRMKALDIKGGNLKARTSLGRIFSKPNAYSYCVLIKENTDGKTSYILAGFTIINVKEKMLGTYLYANYEGLDTLKWLREISKQWSDSILATNK